MAQHLIIERVFLGLGGNIGDCRIAFEKALEKLQAEGMKTVSRSSIYRTAPLYNTNQPDFLNMVVEIKVREKTPLTLLKLCKKLEREAGRKEEEARYGPRPLDIDILYYGLQQIEMPGLSIPHPLIAERLFVLVPFSEIAPDWDDAIQGKTIAEMLKALQEKDPNQAAVIRL